MNILYIFDFYGLDSYSAFKAGILGCQLWIVLVLIFSVSICYLYLVSIPTIPTTIPTVQLLHLSAVVALSSGLYYKNMMIVNDKRHE